MECKLKEIGENLGKGKTGPEDKTKQGDKRVVSEYEQEVIKKTRREMRG